MQKTQPDYLDNLRSTKYNILSKLFAHNIGKIVNFYSDTQTADVEVLHVFEYNGLKYPSTLLSKIPVYVYGSEDAQITLPDLTNTICLILTFDRNISAFMKTGERYEATTNRKHNITDSIALTTFFSLNNPIQNYDTDAITLIYTKTINEIVYSSFIKNFANKITLNVNDAATVELTADENGSAINAEADQINEEANIIDLKSNNGGNINVDSLITIANSAYNLGNLITVLINTIKAINITGSEVSQTSQDALDAVSANFQALLKGNP